MDRRFTMANKTDVLFDGFLKNHIAVEDAACNSKFNLLTIKEI
jgi:hypothetical protein